VIVKQVLDDLCATFGSHYEVIEGEGIGTRQHKASGKSKRRAIEERREALTNGSEETVLVFWRACS